MWFIRIFGCVRRCGWGRKFIVQVLLLNYFVVINENRAGCCYFRLILQVGRTFSWLYAFQTSQEGLRAFHLDGSVSFESVQHFAKRFLYRGARGLKKVTRFSFFPIPIMVRFKGLEFVSCCSSGFVSSDATLPISWRFACMNSAASNWSMNGFEILQSRSSFICSAAQMMRPVSFEMRWFVWDPF